MFSDIDSELYKIYTEKFLNDDVEALALQKNKIKDIDFQFFITQLGLLQRSKHKLPTYYHRRCLFTSKSLQQATSEQVAQFRASLFHGERLIDLTGGLGSDDAAFAGQFKEVLGIDPDKNLNELVRINFLKLNLNNVTRLDGCAEDLWENLPPADLIFCDPDRRPVKDGRSHALESLLPDITELYPKIFHKYPRILTKISPLFDIHEIIKKFNHVAAIWCIAYKNEMKEVCFLIDKMAAETQPKIFAVNLTAKDNYIYPGTMSPSVETPNISDKPQSFFLEPDHALIHSGLWKKLAVEKSYSILNTSTPLLFSDNPIPVHFGRSFELIKCFPFKKEIFKNYIQNKSITSANISFRGMSQMNPAQLLKKFKIQQGGENYFFFPQGSDGTRWFLHGIKLNFTE